MPLNDIYRVKAFQLYGASGPELLNVFYYKQITPGSTDEGAEHLAVTFENTVGFAIRNLQTQTIIWTALEVANIVPSSDFFVQPYVATTGTIVGDTLPPQDAWSFRLNRSTSASRNGQKRFCGVPEGQQINGVANAGFLPTLEVVAELLDDVIGGPAPDNATYQPIIFRAGKPEKTIPAKVIPATFQADFPIDNAQFVSIGTQNTRKFGAGS